MSAWLDGLVAALAAEADLLSGMEGLLAEEAAALGRGDAAAMAALAGRKEAVAIELARLEAMRRVSLAEAGRVLGVPPDALTLDTLARMAPGRSAELAALRARLRSTLTALGATARRNALLIEESLRCVSVLLGALVGALAPAPTYAAAGRPPAPAAAPRLLDRTA